MQLEGIREELRGKSEVREAVGPDGVCPVPETVPTYPGMSLKTPSKAPTQRPLMEAGAEQQTWGALRAGRNSPHLLHIAMDGQGPHQMTAKDATGLS